MKWKRIVLRVILFALLGLLIEVFFTGLGRAISRGDWDLEGDCSLWMLPVYGLLGVCIAPISGALKQGRIPFLLRAALYMVLIFVVEYVFGVIFDRAGLQIWNYSKRPLNLHGYITLTYAPFWYFLGLWLEYLYRKFDACAVTLACRFSADELLERQIAP